MAGTERIYADGGHVLDFVNKAFECLDLIGWEHAAAVLPSLIGPMVAARGAEESTAWRLPVDLLALIESAMAELPEFVAEERPRGSWGGHAALGRALLADDPAAVLAALTRAMHDGAEAADLGRALAYAAALRVARFAPSNEHGDWETAHHVFSYANAVHQALKRLPPAVGRRQEVLRAVFHGAMAVYLARYLNVPPARLPGESGEALDDLPSQPMALQAALLDSFDRRHQVELAARLVARHLRLGHPPDLLITTLATAVLREDAGFHAYQMLEAGVRQFHEWGDTDEGRHVLIAVARYLAAHFPTERASHQTAEMPASCCAAVSCTRVPTRDHEGGRGYGQAARSSGRAAAAGRDPTRWSPDLAAVLLVDWSVDLQVVARPPRRHPDDDRLRRWPPGRPGQRSRRRLDCRLV